LLAVGIAWGAAGQVRGGSQRTGRVLVGHVIGVTWFDVRAERVVQVGARDVVLVAVGGDGRDMALPLLALVEGGGRLIQAGCPGRTVADGGFGQFPTRALISSGHPGSNCTC
jgi:succinate dehydrogenase/fumarate reductase flavoprotein subunit